MTLIRLKKIRMPLVFLLSLILIFEGLFVTAFATDSTPTADTEADTGTYVPEPTPDVGGSLESDVIISPPMDLLPSNDGDVALNSVPSAIIGGKGVFAFQSAANTGLYIDTQYDASSTGYKLQQYAYSTRPTITLANGGFANGGLFKISYRESTDSYIIRSMTNNRLSYKFSGGYIITYEIPANDEDVLDSQTFTITSEDKGVSIKPYGSEYAFATQNTTSSGATGAPYSYLVPKTVEEAGNQAKWYLIRYSGTTKSGFLMEQEPTEDELLAGETVAFKVKTWTTKIPYNEPYLYANTAGIVSSSWNEDNYQLSSFINKDGTFNLNIAVKEGNSQSLIGSKSYTSKLPFEEGLYFFMNRELEQYMGLNGDNTGVEATELDQSPAQQWRIMHHEGKYYKIKSDIALKYLSVPLDSYDSNNVSLEMQNFSADNGQLWYFEKPHADSNSYVIRPKSGENKTTDWCINVKDTWLGLDDGEIVQSDFQNNTSYLDEWVLYSFDKAVLLAFDPYEENVDRGEYFATTESYLEKPRYGKMTLTTTKYFFNATVNEMLTYLESNNVFIIHTHGDQTSFQIKDATGEPTADDKFEKYRIQYTDLSNISFALLLTCEGGNNYDPDHITNNAPVNIAEQMVVCGAETVVGFKIKPTVAFCNDFARDLMKKLIVEQLTVEGAFESLERTNAYYTGLSDKAVIVGNGDNKLR